MFPENIFLSVKAGGDVLPKEDNADIPRISSTKNVTLDNGSLRHRYKIEIHFDDHHFRNLLGLSVLYVILFDSELEIRFFGEQKSFSIIRTIARKVSIRRISSSTVVLSGEFRLEIDSAFSFRFMRNSERGVLYVQMFSSSFTVFTFVEDETRNFSRAPFLRFAEKRGARETEERRRRRRRRRRRTAYFFFRRYDAPPTLCVRRALAPATPNSARWNSTRDDYHALVRTAKRLTNRRGDSVRPREWGEKEGGGRPSLATAFPARVPPGR